MAVLMGANTANSLAVLMTKVPDVKTTRSHHAAAFSSRVLCGASLVVSTSGVSATSTARLL